MSTSLKALKLSCIYLSGFILLMMTGCNQSEGKKFANNGLGNKGENHTDSFKYEIKIYNAAGRVSVYVLTSSKPLTKLDSSNFMEKSLIDERKNKNP